MEINHTNVLDLFGRLRTENANRNGEYDVARQRVDGVLWDAATMPAPVNRYSITANYLLPVTMKHVQLLVGRLPAIQVMPVGTTDEDRLHAEKLEGVLYGIWHDSGAAEVFQRVAWDSFVLRRGLVYYWWDMKANRVKFRHCVPDDFYPDYDGDCVYQAIYTHRRHTDALKEEYPDDADLIFPDAIDKVAHLYGQDQIHMETSYHTTVLDYYDKDGNWARVAGDMFKTAKLGHPEPQVPFIEFPCYPANGAREPKNGIDQLVELNQYLCQLISQKADIIRTFANPTILDHGSGQDAEEIRRAVSANGSVIPMHRDGNISFLNWEGTVPAIDEQVQLILDTLFDISGKPRAAFGQTITNQSGVVTNLALNPTLQSNEYHETLWGERLVLMNRRILQLTEKFGKGKDLTYRGYRPIGADLRGTRLVELQFDGSEVGGWYESRIKWPSAIRTDDPVYVQNIMSQLQSDPPAISLYTALELLGTEDVEAEIDRILEQLEDPRLHPDRLEAGVDAATRAGSGALPGELMGVPPSGGAPSPSPTMGPGMNGDVLEASASPYREQLS